MDTCDWLNTNFGGSCVDSVAVWELSGDEAIPATVHRSPAVAKVLNIKYNQAGKCVVTLEVGSALLQKCLLANQAGNTTINLEVNAD